MNKKSFTLTSLIICILIAAQSYGQNNYQKDFTADDFNQRWQRVYDEIGEKGVAIVQGFAQPNGFILSLIHI